MRITLVRRFMSCLGMVFVLQGLWALATPLPNPIRQCTFKGASGSYETSREAFHIMTDAGADCADLCYSSRVSTLVLIALLWHRYSHIVWLSTIDQLGIVVYHHYDPNLSKPNGDPARCTTVKVLIWGAAVLGLLFVLMAHQHYSIDIACGVALSLWVWQAYHQGLWALKSGAHPGCWLRVLGWLERGAEDMAVQATQGRGSLSEGLLQSNTSDSEDEEMLVREDKHQVVLVVRGDLDLPLARVVAQCTHVVLGLYKRLSSAGQPASRALQQWELWGMPKVTLRAVNEEAMLAAEQLAKTQNLFSHSVTDGELSELAAGRTGKTVVVIGPATTARLSSITKNLSLIHI
eukprot:TRINITY_DN15425_c0_g1_i1.p1 TRINITY_DN15425_c0_g1~~TRINITY_DN15425_c0_g1_i1.p1  ORF type:complete len:348 (-),score=110.32 TRINITY_DN15425_c0_g1_i1:134-1177(-)